MAKMIPLELKEGDYLSGGEKEVFDLFKYGLSDKWLVIYSLRWIPEEDILIGKSSGESDFILIHPDYGIMIIEVKGGIINCINREWTSISRDNVQRTISDPEKQANDAKYNLLSRFRKNNLNPYITTAVFFPDCIVERCTLPLSMPREIILDMTALNNIEKRIIDIFKYRYSKEGFNVNKLSESDYIKIINILNPETKIKMPLLILTSKLNMKYIKLNEEQNQVFQQLEGNNFITVKGHAGTGKTVLAIKKAFRESEAGKRVLFLCYNSLLRKKIIDESEGAFEVSSIYTFASDYLKKFKFELYNKFQEFGDYDEMMKDFLVEVLNNKTKNKLLFDMIIIDEGQDFTEEWFHGINELLDEDGSMCVFYDEYQTLYSKYGRKDISFLDKGTKYILMRNMRNTDEICSCSLKVINANKNIKLNGVNGIKPDFVFSEDVFDTTIHLKNAIRELKKNEYLRDENIAVLTMEAKKKNKFKQALVDEFNGVVESIRKFKGLESDVVIIPDLSNNFMEDEELRKLLYVGISRAKAHVILIINTEAFNRKQRASYKKEIKEILL